MVTSRFLTTLACRAQCPAARVEAVPLDLASLASVRALADKCLQSGRALSVLCNNAGDPFGCIYSVYTPYSLCTCNSAGICPLFYCK